MRSRLLYASCAWLAALVMTGQSQAADVWKVEDQSAISFTATQQGADVTGGFEAFTAEIVFDRDNLDGSRVSVEIDAASITTGHKDRDATLRSKAFFEVETWPKARFVSDRLVELGDSSYEAHGQLTIREVTKDVVLRFELTIADDPNDAGRELAIAKGDLSVSRLDYGVGQGEWQATTTVGEMVVIGIDIVASRER